jgi:rare lipoprotein A
MPRAAAATALVALAVLAAACSRSAPPQGAETRAQRPAFDPRTGTSASPRVIADGQRIPKGGGTYKVGAPYQVSGRWHYPREEPGYDRRGIASWYGDDFHGRRTANGEIYDMHALTAAHPTLPIPSYVWVTNEQNGRTLLVRVNDRGPYAHDRIIDLSRAVARALGTEGRGLGEVRVRYAGPAPLNGDDRREQAFLRQQPWYASLANDRFAQRRTPLLRPQAAAAEPPRWVPTLAPGRAHAPWPAPPPSQAVPGARRYVVAGAFRSEPNARRRALEVRPFGEAEVLAIGSGPATIFRVRVGPMDEAAAQRLRARLAGAGILDVLIASD